MKFRRKAQSEPVDDDGSLDDLIEPEADHDSAAVDRLADGPLDSEELVADDGVERVDLGSLLIAPEPSRELRLQVDEASGAVQSVVIAGPDGALELRAFAAPRNGDLWSEVRPQIAAEVARGGGAAATKPDDAAHWEDTIRKVTVHRGAHAMPVGEPLAIVMPPQARRVDQ